MAMDNGHGDQHFRRLLPGGRGQGPGRLTQRCQRRTRPESRWQTVVLMVGNGGPKCHCRCRTRRARRRGLTACSAGRRLVMAASGATFTVGEDEIVECQERARPGVLDIRTTVPLPGTKSGAQGLRCSRKKRPRSESIDIPWDAGPRPLKSSGTGDQPSSHFLKPPAFTRRR